MRTLGLAIALLLVATPAFADWQTVAPKGAHFSVKVPAAPELKTTDVATGAGKVPVTVYVATAGGVQYMATANDRPTSAQAGTVAEVFDRGLAPFVAKAPIIASKDATYRGAPMREVVFSDHRHTVRVRIVLAGHRVYMLMVIADRQGATNASSDVATADAEKFLTSLRY